MYHTHTGTASWLQGNQIQSHWSPIKPNLNSYMQLSTSATSENQHYIAGSRKDVRNPGKGALHGGRSLHARVSFSAYETAAIFLLEHADPTAHPPNRYRRTYTTTYTPLSGYCYLPMHSRIHSSTFLLQPPIPPTVHPSCRAWMDSFLTAWSISTETYSTHTIPRLADEGIKFEAL